MSREERDFERFSRRLDDEWRRERIRAQAPPLIDESAEAALVEEFERADPLGAAAWGWFMMVREAFRTWPARVAFAGAACALLIVGFAVGRATGPGGVRVGLGGIPPTPVETPEYEPDAGTALGIGAAVKPESDRKFREAMAFYRTRDFPRKALPLLREAVTIDATNDRAQFWLGIALLLEGKAAEAIAPLQAATRLAPGSLIYKEYLLFAYLQIGAVDRALSIQTELMKRP